MSGEDMNDDLISEVDSFSDNFSPYRDGYERHYRDDFDPYYGDDHYRADQAQRRHYRRYSRERDEPDHQWGRGVRFIANDELPFPRDAWRVPEPQFLTLAKVLAKCNSRICWILRDESRIVFMSGAQTCMIYECTDNKNPRSRKSRLETLVPRQWALPDVIRIFGYEPVTDDAWDGYWVIKKSLTYVGHDVQHI
jgi:hypothetical protein